MGRHEANIGTSLRSLVDIQLTMEQEDIYTDTTAWSELPRKQGRGQSYQEGTALQRERVKDRDKTEIENRKKVPSGLLGNRVGSQELT